MSEEEGQDCAWVMEYRCTIHDADILECWNCRAAFCTGVNGTTCPECGAQPGGTFKGEKEEPSS